MRAAIALFVLCAALLTPAPAHAGRWRHWMGGWTRVTQYTDCCITASGWHVYYGEVAAPPWIPFGSIVVIPGLGRFTVRDRGGAVWGNHLDLWVPWYPFRGIRDYYAGVFWY